MVQAFACVHHSMGRLNIPWTFQCCRISQLYALQPFLIWKIIPQICTTGQDYIGN